MRQVLVVAAALGMMWSLHGLQVSGEAGQVDPLTLAAIGFIVLAAFALGEMGASLGLPKVTGYILGGVLLGPQVLDVLSERVVAEMQVFNTLALGLIATTAGLELDLKAIRRVGRTLTATVMLKLPALLVLVGGAFWAVQTWVPVLPLTEPAAVLATGLVLATLGVGTSPAIALAVVSETGARGRLSDLVLSLAVVKDLVVVVSLALAVAAARVLLEPEGVLDVHVLTEVGQELGLSLALGLTVGAVVVLYLRFVAAEMLLFVVVTVLLVAEVCHRFHLELLLVLIAAGFLVRNFSPYEKKLLKPLQRVALPVFVVFFATAGATVDLQATLAVLPLAVVLSLARAVAYLFAGHLGGRLGGETQLVQRYSWMAYLPQAGVTLGLVFLAADALPELAVPVRQTGTALVALHLLVGPVLLSLALHRTGEVARPEGEAASDSSLPSETGALVGSAPVEPCLDDGPPEQGEAPGCGERRPPSLAELVAPLAEDGLAPEVKNLGELIEHRVQQFLEKDLAPLADQARRMGERLFADVTHLDEVPASAVQLLAHAAPQLPPDWEQRVRQTYWDVAQLVQQQPPTVWVPMRPNMLQSGPGETLGVRSRKLGRRMARRLGLASGRQREVALQAALRVSLEPRLAEGLGGLGASWFQLINLVLVHIRGMIRGVVEPGDALGGLGQATAAWHEQVAQELNWSLRAGLAEAVTVAATMGVPGGRERPRYSRVEARVRQALGRLDADRDGWRRRAQAAFDTLRAVVGVERARVALGQTFEQQVWQPLELVHETLLPLATGVRRALVELQRRAQRETKQLDEPTLRALLEETKGLLPAGAKNQLRQMRVRFRRETRKSAFHARMAALLESLPPRLELLAPGTTLDATFRPEAIELVEVEFARVVEQPVNELLLPRLMPLLSAVSALAASYEARLREIMHVATYGLELGLRGKLEDLEERRELVVAALSRAVGRCDALLEDTQESLRLASEGARVGSDTAEQVLERMLEERPGTTETVLSSVHSRGRALARGGSRLVQRGRRLLLQLEEAARAGVARQRQVQDWLIEAGHRRLDAVRMGMYVRQYAPPMEELPLPRLLAEALTLAPVDDRRLIAVHRAEVEEVLRVIGGAAKRPRSNILVSGQAGSGRTSFLNELEYRLAHHRLVRLEAAFHRRSEGLTNALAAELGCPAEEEALVESLSGRVDCLFVDNLEHFPVPTLAGWQDLERFLGLVIASLGNASWVVTVSSEVLPQLERAALPFRELFACQLTLPPLGWRDLQAVIEKRHRLAGVTVEYRTYGGWVARALRWRQGVQEELYYRALNSSSSGALRSGILAHARALLADASGGSATVRAPQRSVLPFLGQVGEQCLAILGLLARFGPLTEETVEEALLARAEEVMGHVAFLVQARLVERSVGASGSLLSLPQNLEDAIVAELRELRVLREARA